MASEDITKKNGQYNAEQIQVPGGVVWIGPDAFSPETVLVVNPGSYAEDWARDNGQPYIY